LHGFASVVQANSLAVAVAVPVHTAAHTAAHAAAVLVHNRLQKVMADLLKLMTDFVPQSSCANYSRAPFCIARTRRPGMGFWFASRSLFSVLSVDQENNMSYTSVERIVELPLDRLPINWSNVSEEALAELQQYLEQSAQQQLSDLEEDRRTVQRQIGKTLVHTEQAVQPLINASRLQEQDGISQHRTVLEQ
jgi:hypothetical protein